MVQHFIDFLAESNDIIVRLHLYIQQHAIAFIVSVRMLNTLLGIWIATLDSSNILQTNGLPAFGVGNNDLLTQLMFSPVRHIHVYQSSSHVVGYLAGQRSETLRRQTCHNEILVDTIFGDALHIQGHRNLFVLLTKDLDTTHLFDIAQLVTNQLGIVLQLTRSALVALDGKQHTAGVAEIVDDRHG